MSLILRYNIKSLLARPATTLASVGLIALIIGTFAYLQAVFQSAFDTMAQTGDPNTLMVMSQAAESETVSGISREELSKLDTTPGIAAVDGIPIISRELVAISSARTDADDAVQVNVAVRGVDFSTARLVHHERLRMIAGRPFRPGTYEVIVGQSASRMYLGHGIGERIPLGSRGLREFEIVGIFSTAGTSADSEVWGDVETLRDVYGRSRYSSVRLLVANERDGRQAIEFIEGPSVELLAQTERDYFSTVNTNQTVTRILSIAMVMIMGTAAVFAVANTMYSAVAGRATEIGMLRALGFGRSTVLLSFVFEGLLLATAGGVLGCALSLLCHGWQRTMLPSTFTTVSYSLAITPKILFSSLAVALLIGFLGTVLPAWHHGELSVIGTLREA